MVSIVIKTSKPFVEKVVQAKLNGKELKENITIGVKLYTGETLENIRSNYLENLSTAKVIRWQKQLQELPLKLDLSDEDFDNEVKHLESCINTWNKNYSKNIDAFCKEHIAYIKNASITIEDGGVVSDLLIPDSRDAKPIESLWATPEECLVVLLDTYLGHPAYKDSLISIVPGLVFNSDFEDKKLGN